jgi:zinc transport system permease protein
VFEVLIQALRHSYMQYALVAGGLTALAAALIGVPLVLKRYSPIGDGLSHVAFCGDGVCRRRQPGR